MSGVKNQQNGTEGFGEKSKISRQAKEVGKEEVASTEKEMAGL